MNGISGFMVDDSNYSEYGNDYAHLGGVIQDIASGAKSIVASIWNAITPTIPAVVYKQATGQNLPPTSQTVVMQAPERPATPITTYLMYGAAAILAGMVIYKVVKK